MWFHYAKKIAWAAIKADVRWAAIDADVRATDKVVKKGKA